MNTQSGKTHLLAFTVKLSQLFSHLLEFTAFYYTLLSSSVPCYDYRKKKKQKAIRTIFLQRRNSPQQTVIFTIFPNDSFIVRNNIFFPLELHGETNCSAYITTVFGNLFFSMEVSIFSVFRHKKKISKFRRHMGAWMYSWIIYDSLLHKSRVLSGVWHYKSEKINISH